VFLRLSLESRSRVPGVVLVCSHFKPFFAVLVLILDFDGRLTLVPAVIFPLGYTQSFCEGFLFAFSPSFFEMFLPPFCCDFVEILVNLPESFYNSPQGGLVPLG